MHNVFQELGVFLTGFMSLLTLIDTLHYLNVFIHHFPLELATQAAPFLNSFLWVIVEVIAEAIVMPIRFPLEELPDLNA